MSALAPVPISNPPSGWFDYRYFVLSDGALAVLRTDRDIDAEYRAWWKRAQKARFLRKMPNLWSGKAQLSTLAEDGERAAINIPLVRYPQVDRFPDGRWLLAASRASAAHGPGFAVQNGFVLEQDGQLSHSLTLGDSINHIRCAPDGTIWVGYFDEGVFGSTVGAGGIVRFNDRGQQLWSYNNETRDRQTFVDDCYALTLNRDELWSCFYSAFPILRLKDARETYWANSVSGVRALAVQGSFVLLAGGYGADSKRLSLVELRREEARLVGSYELPELKDAALTQGRSSIIHIVSNGYWNRISVADARSRLQV